MRNSDRLSWLILGVSLCLAHCATAEQDDPDGEPFPSTGGVSTTGGERATGGASPSGGVFNPMTNGGLPGASGGVTGGKKATGGASPSSGSGGRAPTGGQSSLFGGFAGKSGQGGSGIFGGGGDTGDGGEPPVSSTGGVMTGTGGATPVDPCSDGKRNGSETDVDCGGSCDPCAEGMACKVGGDCAGAQCNAGVCAPDHCGDGEPSGDESDEDCGGSCAVCALGMACETGNDCEGGNCDAGTCAVPGNCVYGWKDDACGELCLSRTQSDQRACEQVLDCFVANDCGPASCTGITQICGNNTLQQGSAPYPYAAQVYDCMCK